MSPTFPGKACDFTYVIYTTRQQNFTHEFLSPNKWKCSWMCQLRSEGCWQQCTFGFDKGLVAIKLGQDEPSLSMDLSRKLTFTHNTDVLLANLHTIRDTEAPEGQHIPISTWEIGSTEIYATSLQHSPNRWFITVVGDGEYIIYTVLGWRSKSFSTGSSFGQMTQIYTWVWMSWRRFRFGSTWTSKKEQLVRVKKFSIFLR